MRNGNVLILDEPTASLDPESEFEAFRGLSQQTSEQIVFLVSHRFSTVRMADDILVLDDGVCIEHGSHHELMDKGGHYAHLFRLQARGYESVSPFMDARSFNIGQHMEESIQ